MCYKKKVKTDILSDKKVGNNGESVIRNRGSAGTQCLIISFETNKNT